MIANGSVADTYHNLAWPDRFFIFGRENIKRKKRSAWLRETSAYLNNFKRYGAMVDSSKRPIVSGLGYFEGYLRVAAKLLPAGEGRKPKGVS